MIRRKIFEIFVFNIKWSYGLELDLWNRHLMDLLELS